MKRQTSGGSDGPSKKVMLNSETILRHQNRELASSFKTIKDELNSTQNQLKALDAQRNSFDAVLSTIDRAWKLLDFDLESVANRLGLPSIDPSTSIVSHSSNGNNNNNNTLSIPSSSRLIQVLSKASDKYILADVTQLNGEEEDDEEEDENEDEEIKMDIDETLAKKIKWTTSLLTRILQTKESSLGDNIDQIALIRSLEAKNKLFSSKLLITRKMIKELKRNLEESRNEIWKVNRRLARAIEGGEESLEQLRRQNSTEKSTTTGSTVLHPSSNTPPTTMETGTSPSPPIVDEQPVIDFDKPTIDELKELADGRLNEIERLRQQLRDSMMSSSSLSHENNLESSSFERDTKLMRELEKAQQDLETARRTADRANLFSQSLLVKYQEAEEKITQLEKLSDLFVKTAESSLSKENAYLRQVSEQMQQKCSNLSNELITSKSKLEQSKEFEIMLNSVVEEKNALTKKLERIEHPPPSSEESEALIVEIEEISRALNEARSQNTRLHSRISERDKRISELLTEKGGIESEVRELREEKNAFALRSEKAQAVLLENESYISKLEERLNSEKIASQKAEELARITTLTCENALDERNNMARELEAEKEKVLSYAKYEEEIKINRIKVEEIRGELSRSEEEVKTLKRRLERAKAALESRSKSGSSSQSIDEIRLEAMTSALHCPVYQNLWKDCVITKCAHMFSRRALEDNLAQRNRKCPSCKNTYSKDDILSVYLYQSNDAM